MLKIHTTMKSISIKGKPYVTVNERLKFFRESEAFKDYKMITDIVELSDDRVVMVTSILNELDQTVAQGHAYEDKDSTFINKTSYIENCETSSWGRALASMGIGVLDAVASADEVVNAIAQSEDKPWMNHTEFNTQCEMLNREDDKSKRMDHVKTLYERFKVKRDYRSQFDEIVTKRDIDV